jgi:coproporphyrinogen III oxidase-like Fe-S oxidoreductase
LTKINLQRLRKRYGGEIFGSDDIRSLGRFVRAELNADLIQANYLAPTEKISVVNRWYTIEQSKEAIRILDEEFPDIDIRTQLMVGFPGEKEEDFQASHRILDEVSIDYVEIYEFEARPNTVAERMEDQVPRHVAKKRALQLLLQSLFNERERRRKAIQRYRNFRKKESAKMLLSHEN